MFPNVKPKSYTLKKGSDKHIPLNLFSQHQQYIHSRSNLLVNYLLIEWELNELSINAVVSVMMSINFKKAWISFFYHSSYEHLP
jgi:hypothetical protein